MSGALIVEGVVLLGEAASIVWEAKQVLGLSFWDTLKMAYETPLGPYERYVDPSIRPVTPLAEELSRIASASGRNNGSCDEKEFIRMKDWQEQWCTGARACSSGTDVMDIRRLREKNLMCVKWRIEIMDKCFDGGDQSHKDDAKRYLKQYRSCQGMKPAE